jgi:UDP-N-acetylmuramoyl-tripeptide--D-alanyl-D-alanine ligase
LQANLQYFMEISKLYEIFEQHPHVIHDSRKIIPGCIYWAIRGERFDGNRFAGDALKQGAAYAIVDHPDYKTSENCILVDDSLKTLQDLAKFHRRRCAIPVIAIAGSNGKTTTKELVHRVLNEKMEVFATPGNFNNHIGLPLSILQITKNHKAAVLELGANHAGENAFLCEIAEPDMGIVTNIGKDHLEGFGGMDGVEKANMELFDYLKKHHGLAFVNVDDERIRRNTGTLNTLRYGSNLDADIAGEIISKFPTLSVSIKNNLSESEFAVNSNLFGSVNIYNILAAAAVGAWFETDPWQIKNAIESYIPENNRSQIIKKNGNTFILDAYNANPSSMLPAIKDFASYPAPFKVLILGDMFELGADSEAEHENMLEQIEYAQFDEVALAGKEFNKFKDRYPAHFFETTDELKTWFNSRIFEDTVFYIKGSRGMALEKILGIRY